VDELMIEELITRCTENNLGFGSFSSYLGEYLITVHDAKLAGIKPRLDECRDYRDYELMMDAWRRRGIVILAKDKDPIRAIQLAIAKLSGS